MTVSLAKTSCPPKKTALGYYAQDLALRASTSSMTSNPIIQSFRVITLAVHERDVPGDVLFTLSFKVLHLLASLEISRVNNALSPRKQKS